MLKLPGVIAVAETVAANPLGLVKPVFTDIELSVLVAFSTMLMSSFAFSFTSRPELLPRPATLNGTVKPVSHVKWSVDRKTGLPVVDQSGLSGLSKESLGLPVRSQHRCPLSHCPHFFDKPIAKQDLANWVYGAGARPC
jgi:hypothetical protein